jgi:hypothetical protein
MDQAERANRRRCRRWNVIWPAVVSHGDRQYPCTILDISERGARVEGLAGSLPKAAVKLQCERFGSLEGWLIWTRGKVAGIGFAAAPAEIVRVLKPVVPGLDRRDLAALAPAPRTPPRPAFGRKSAPCGAEAEPPAAKTTDQPTESDTHEISSAAQTVPAAA